MATSQHTAAAGQQAFSELLFSPRAAFIWDHTRKSVAWMNAAARTKIKLSLHDLSEALPERVRLQFSQCFGADGSKQSDLKSITVKLPGLKLLRCSLEAFDLAGGHDGLIVAEVQTLRKERQPASASAVKRAAIPSKPVRRKLAKINQVPHHNHPVAFGDPPRAVAQNAPQLTPEEMRSFKAVGKMVRKLCREKRRAISTSARNCGPPQPFLSEVTPSGGEKIQIVRGILSTFDLVLFLDENLRILNIEGRAKKLGWRKSALQNQAAGMLFNISERILFERMAAKLRNGSGRSCKETVIVRAEEGGTMPCRAALVRWMTGDAAYFLALLSLELPPRIKKLPHHGLNLVETARLAA